MYSAQIGCICYIINELYATAYHEQWHNIIYKYMCLDANILILGF